MSLSHGVAKNTKDRTFSVVKRFRDPRGLRAFVMICK